MTACDFQDNCCVFLPMEWNTPDCVAGLIQKTKSGLFDEDDSPSAWAAARK